VEHGAGWAAAGLDEAAWRRLAAAASTRVPFLGWAFQTTWAAAFLAGPPDVYAVRDAAGEAVGALALYAEPGPGGAVGRLVGGLDVADYLDVVAVAGREAEVWEALLPALAAGPWRALDLRPVPAGSPTAALLPGLAKSAGFTCEVSRADRCPVIDLPESWEAFLALLSGKERHELRRKLRRAEGAHPRLQVGRTPAEVAALMDAFLALHRTSTAAKAEFMDERMEGFFRTLGAALAAEGQLALWVLWVEERPAATLLCFEHEGTVSLYNSGFEPSARALSPGVIVVARTIEDAIARGFRRYDFLRGEEPYKYAFGARPVDVLRLALDRAWPRGEGAEP
jgi:CelD/BcsL family acetyltransferase involved in cellulose biosynthesis